MKILFITNYSQLYGANRSLLTILEYLNAKEDYDIRLLLPSKGDMTEKLEKEKISYLTFPYFSSLFYVKLSKKYLILPFLFLMDLLVFPILLWKIYKINPDIIYSNNSAENLGVIFSKILSKKHISHIREFMSLDYGAKFIGGRKCKKRFLNLSDGLIFVSKAVAEYTSMEIFNELIVRKNNKLRAIVYNGITCNNDIIAKEYNNGTAPNFGLVGILDAAKGQDMAIQYFKKVVDSYPLAKLYLFGDKEGAYKKNLQKQIKNLSLTDSAILRGFVSDTKEIYANMDVLLMFSKSEGFGRVTVEAMGAGIPVLGYKGGGTVELIKHKETGWLFEDEVSFLEGVDYILDSSNYNILSKKSISHVVSNFNANDYAISIEKSINMVFKINKCASSSTE